MTFKDRFGDWLVADAEWYQFWRPQSGARGGFILAALLAAVTFMLVKIGS